MSDEEVSRPLLYPYAHHEEYLFHHPLAAAHTQYDNGESSSYVEVGGTFFITYGSGNVSGFFSEDTLGLGGISVSGQSFAEVTFESGEDLEHEKFDGILGLGFKELSVGGVTPVFDQMIEQDLVGEPVFSVYLNREGTSSEGGEILFGGIDETHYSGDITYIPISQEGYWQIHIDGIQAGDATACSGGCEGIVDTGTSLITGPSDEITKLNNDVGATPSGNGRYVVDCDGIDSMPNVTFTLDGKDFALEGKDYVAQVSFAIQVAHWKQFPLRALVQPTCVICFPSSRQCVCREKFN